MKLVTNNIAVGAGLISLDVLIWDGQRVPISYYVGGTCGNVMMILAYMGWDVYPKRGPQSAVDLVDSEYGRLIIEMTKKGLSR